MRTRRGRGEGSIYRRADGLWCGSITVGYDEAGRRRRRIVYGRSKAEAREKLATLHSTAATGSLGQATRQTVATYLRTWLDDVHRAAIRKSTYASYDSIIRKHIVPHVGGIQLARLEPLHVQQLYGRLDQLGVSKRVAELVHAVLRRALKPAARQRLVARNVCDDVDKPRAPKKEMKYWTEQEVARFLKAARRDRLYVLYLLAVTTGLRQGELLGLRWSDIDWKAGALAVQRTAAEDRGTPFVQEPKTKKGKRRVELPRMAVVALREHRKRMMAEGTASEWVFADAKGGLIRRSNLIRRMFHPLLALSKVRRLRFHDLRHTAATLLLLKGVHPKVVQERLGHATIAVTLDTYSHLLPSLQKDAAAKLEDLLQGHRR